MPQAAAAVEMALTQTSVGRTFLSMLDMRVRGRGCGRGG